VQVQKFIPAQFFLTFLKTNKMKNLKNKTQKVSSYSYMLLTLILMTSLWSCSDADDCVYDTNINESCELQAELNLSTGIDTNGNVITPTSGAVDPNWHVINQPPLISCSEPVLASFNGDAYVMNYNNSGPDAWVNQTGSSTIAPFDLGTSNNFYCNNPINSMGETIPYLFERSFCVLQDTNVDFNFTFKGDDQITFELVKNNPLTVISTSSTFVWGSSPPGLGTWSATNLPLTSGSYSIRAKLVNTVLVTLGFSLLGNLVTTNGDASISDNSLGCCENNIISILNILDDNCNDTFDSGDLLGEDWTFNLKDSDNTIIRTSQTDINGNIFFSGLPDGTYTIEIQNEIGFTQSLPNTTGSINITVSNNDVQILEFLNCPE